jgi:hypothetical protein
VPEGQQHRLLPWLTGAGFIIVALALFWLWRHPPPTPASSQLGELEARVAALEQRPAPAAPDLAPLAARVTALEQRPAAQPGAPAPDFGPLTARLAALERRQQPDTSALEARVGALEKSDHADEARLGSMERSIGHAAQVEAARVALDAGQKLGPIPNAPPALARFADAPPPTETARRLAFPDAARVALQASQPALQGKPLLARIWARTQDLVTIRQGDRVVVGDPASGVLQHAQAALDAGDLAAAVAAVSSLDGPAAQAMAGWLAQARALLDARAALISWAAQG